MIVGNKVTYDAINQAYCLLTAWLREEKIVADYNTRDIADCVMFLAEILKHPENFVEEETEEVVETVSLDHDGRGLA